MIEARGVHKKYQQSQYPLHVLKGIDLKVQEGDILTIVGPSGAGKSTLLHILGGLDRPSEGTVLLDDQDLYALKERDRADVRNKKVGFVFQFYHLLPEFTALENVLLPAIIKTNAGQMRQLKEKGLSLLNEVGLKERSAHRPSQLSGGEQQRVAIARSLMNEPRIIFCDEPTGNLDSESSKTIVELLLALNKKHQYTFIIVTHDEEIAKRSHTVLHMRDGKILN